MVSRPGAGNTRDAWLGEGGAQDVPEIDGALDIGIEVGGTRDPGADCAGSRGAPRGSEGHQVRRWDMHQSTAATQGTHVRGLVLAVGAGPPTGAYGGRAVWVEKS
jgi:hypothetical protein